MGLDESSVRSCSASLTSISWGFVGKTFIQPLKNECIYPTKTRISISWGKPEQTFLQLWLAGGWGTILMPLFHQHHPPATGWEPDLAPCPAVLVPGRLRLPLDFFFFCWVLPAERCCATCGCKLNCDKYTERCIAWRLKSMLSCAQTKLFSTCTSFKWCHFKGAAYFVACMDCFFLPGEKYQNSKSSLEKVLSCLVISWEIFFYLYMQMLLRHIRK